MSDYENTENILDESKHGKSCPVTACQKANVCIPVTIKPFGIPGKTRIKCCGKACIVNGSTCASGKKSCSFTISQDIYVEIPVEFGAEAKVGEASIDCTGVSLE